MIINDSVTWSGSNVKVCLNFMKQRKIEQGVGVVELWYILCGLSKTNCKCVVEMGKGSQLRRRVGRERRGYKGYKC